MRNTDTSHLDDPNGSRIGRYVATVAFNETVRAYVPPPLPPSPPLVYSAELLNRLSAADRAIGQLDGAAMLLPNQALFTAMYIRKEAALSSQIEGIEATLDDLLRFENEVSVGKPLDGIAEVSNYVAAMMHGLDRLNSPKGLPLCLRLLREMHAELLHGGRSESKLPGEFRRSQNWIGGTRPDNAEFVPPPINEMGACLSDLERFLHDESQPIPPLVKAGMLHVQFETIHPFLDGNGRIGRMLITLFLVEKGVLREPLLYLSLFLKARQDDYYRLLREVSRTGNWEAWLEFFLEGVAETANNAFESAMRIVSLFHSDREKIAASGDQPPQSMLSLHDLLQERPFLNSAQARQRSGLSAPTVNKAFEGLEGLGIVREITGKLRGRVFAYGALLDILGAGTAIAT